MIQLHRGKNKAHSPSQVSDELRLREAFFVRFYTGEARGNGRQAARLAGYRGSTEVLDVQASRLLRRPRVHMAIQEVIAREVDHQVLTKEYLVRKVHEVLLEGRPFERLRAIELLGKLMGWFQARQARPANGARYETGSYEGLAETLRAHSSSFTPEGREAFRTRLLEDRAQISQALLLLGDSAESLLTPP